VHRARREQSIVTPARKLVFATLILVGGFAGARMFPRLTPSAAEKNRVATGLEPAQAEPRDDRPAGRAAGATAARSRTDTDHRLDPAGPAPLRPTYSDRAAARPEQAAILPTSRVPTARPASIPRRTHRIVDGDTLARLAERYLGDPNRAGEIFQLNRQLLPSPKILPIGAVLQLPPRNRPAVTTVTPARPRQPDRPAAPALPPTQPAASERDISTGSDSEESDDLVPIPPGLFHRRTG